MESITQPLAEQHQNGNAPAPPADVEYAEEAPTPASIDGTWVIAQQDSDGRATYWSKAGPPSLLLHEGVAVWPTKDAAVDAVREELGKMPRSHKPVKLTEEQAVNIGSPYRIFQGELVSDELPTEFSEMDPDEAIAAADKWVREAQSRAVRANNAMGSAVEAAWYAGSALIAAKERVRATGQKWIPWLENESDFHHSARLAQYYMALAKKRNTVSFLDHDVSLRSAIKQITVTKPQPGKTPPQLNDSEKAKKKLTKQVAAKLTMINEAGTYIADLDEVVKQLAKERDHKPVNTFTSGEVDTINEWVSSLRDIWLTLSSLTKPAFADGTEVDEGEEEYS
jgi:hypothetical protein